MATILIVSATGPADATRASLPFHIGVNGVAASGNRCGIALAGDATDLLKEEHRNIRGIGIPAFSDLLNGCVDVRTVHVDRPFSESGHAEES